MDKFEALLRKFASEAPSQANKAELRNYLTATRRERTMRWVAMVPSGALASTLAGLLVNLFFWLTVLPFRLLEHAGFGLGLIGRCTDSVSQYLFGMGFMAAANLAVSGYATGFWFLLVTTTVSPADKRRTCNVVGGVSFLVMLIGLIAAVLVRTFNGHAFILSVSIFSGLVLCFSTLRSESAEQEQRRDDFVSRNLKLIFAAALIFSAAAMYFTWRVII